LIDILDDEELIEQLTYEINDLSKLDYNLNNFNDDLESFRYKNNIQTNINKLKNIIKGNRKNV